MFERLRHTIITTYCTLPLLTLAACSEETNLGATQVSCLCNCPVCEFYDPFTGECLSFGAEPVEAVACADDPAEGQTACTHACSNIGCGLFLATFLDNRECTLSAPSPMGAGRVMAPPVRNTTEVVIDPDLSLTAVTFDGDTSFVRPHGTVRFTGGDCPGATCPISLSFVSLVLDDFELDGHELDGSSLVNDGVVSGEKDGSEGLDLNRTSILLVATAQLDGTQRAREFFPADNIGGSYDPVTGNFVIQGTLVEAGSTPDEDRELELLLQGTATARPPIADAGVDQSVACDAADGSADVTLDASASSDPDGDLSIFTWREGMDGIANGAMPTLRLSAGSHTLTLDAVDATGRSDRDEVVIEVTTSPAEILNLGVQVEVCKPAAQTIAISEPPVVGGCGPITLSGRVTEINGHAVVPPLDIVGGQLVLPVGTHTIHWTARDELGAVVDEADQALLVAESSGTNCCLPGQTVIEGGPGQDVIEPNAATAYCLIGHASGDQLVSLDFDDVLLGGQGSDHLVSGRGNDLVIGGTEQDAIHGGLLGGHIEAYGGASGDAIYAVYSDSSELHGGRGSDHIVGSPGDDLIVPGPGADSVAALAGDDTVVLYDECEAEAGKVLDGGGGQSDTLISPLSVAELANAGVAVLGFEQVIINTSQAHLSECFDG